MISDELTAALIAFSMFYGFMVGRGSAMDGLSPFWTGYMDIITLRILWQRSPSPGRSRRNER
jgi:hypothetical protein